MTTSLSAEAAGPKGVKIPKKNSTTACVSINVRWKKANGADGYLIYRSTNRFFGYKQVKSVKSDGVLAYNDSSVKESKVYYYKVRAYKNKDGKKVFLQYTSYTLDKVMRNVTGKKVTIKGFIKNIFR